MSSQLKTACAEGDLAQVDRLLLSLSDGDNATTLTTISSEALCEASRNGHAAVVQRLLAAGADVHIEDEASLQAACKGGHCEVIKRLLAAGAHVQAGNDRAMFLASEHGHPDAVELLLAAGANAYTGLSEASKHGHVAVVERLLGASNKAKESVKRLQYCHAMVDASKIGHTAVVELLVHAGADVHWKNNQALCAASRNGHAAVVEKLLAGGADVHARNEEALCAACEDGHTAVVELLLAAGARVDVPEGDEEDQPLLLACSNGHVDVVRRLLAAGADTGSENTYPVQDPLFHASKNGHTAVVEVLLAAGANVHGMHEDDMPLYQASSKGHEDVVKCLLAAGATVDVLTLAGASENGWINVVERLLAAGVVSAHGDVTYEYGQAVEEALSTANDRVIEPWHVNVAARLLVAGASAKNVPWRALDREDICFLMPCVRRDEVTSLPSSVQACWFRHNFRLRRRLRARLDAARARLHAPPRQPSGKAHPSRDELIAELRSAGRAFARDYWQQGAAVFGLQDLGEMPAEFREVFLRGE